jgi:hypothetical protein
MIATSGGKTKTWNTFSGKDLLRLELRGELRDVLPTTSGIYAWRRKFAVPIAAASDGQALVDWVGRLVATPSAVIVDKPLSHFLQVHKITIGGRPLTHDKIETLREWAQDISSRKWLIEIIQSISEMCPPLYVGETDNIARRVKEHITDATQFANTLRDVLNLNWDDCSLHYCSVPTGLLSNDPKAKRTLIELLVSRLTIAPSTTRPG